MQKKNKERMNRRTGRKGNEGQKTRRGQKGGYGTRCTTRGGKQVADTKQNRRENTQGGKRKNKKHRET